MIRLLSIQTYVLPMQTRMPLRYGIATLTALTHVVVRARVWWMGWRAWPSRALRPSGLRTQCEYQI